MTLAEAMELTQRAVAHWEVRPGTALRPDQLARLADLLDISLDELIIETKKPPSPRGPKGKLRKCFEEASELTKSQQQKVIALLEAFIAQQKAKA